MTELMSKDEIEDRCREGREIHLLAVLGIFNYPVEQRQAALFQMTKQLAQGSPFKATF